MRFFFVFAFVLSLGVNTGFATTNFSDQEKIPDWAKIPISILVETEVLSGNSDGSFQPDRNLNRAEFCKILVQATGVKKFLPQESHFPDIETSDWFFSYIETAKHHGWLAGYPDGTFRPGNSVNRAEVAKILANAFGFEASEAIEGEDWYETYFHTLNENKLLPYGTEFHNLGPDQTPTRAEISEQIFRAMKKVGKISALDFPEIQTIQTPSSTQTPPAFEYYTPSSSSSTPTVSQDAGKLYVEKNSSLGQKYMVRDGQKNVIAHKIKFMSKEGLSEISSFQFRRIGSGASADFSNIWIEHNGNTISEKITPTADLVQLTLRTPLTIGSSQQEIILKVDISQSASSDKSSRWVLFLPEWIEANTNTKIGFFPIGGCDLEVE